MDELDDQYLRWYWHEIGGTPPQEKTMRCSIDLDDEAHGFIDDIRDGLDKLRGKDGYNDLAVIIARNKCDTVDGIVKFALATTADEINRRLAWPPLR